MCSALEKLQPRVVSFEDSVTLLRENLAAILEKEEDWSKAAQILSGIDLDSSSRQVRAVRALCCGAEAHGQRAFCCCREGSFAWPGTRIVIFHVQGL